LTLNLPSSLGLTDEQKALLSSVTFADVHEAAVQMGAVSVLGIFDALTPFKPKESWSAWRAFLCALFALPMSEAERKTYEACTARTEPPAAPAREADVIVGRRGGKDRICSFLAFILASCRDYTPYLAPGQRGYLPVIAADRKQSREIMSYLKGIYSLPQFEHLVESMTGEQIRLKNRVTIEIFTSAFRTARGYTLIGAVCNEIAFWRNDESKNPDEEIVNKAIRPGMSTIPNALLLCLSSPYARKGVLYTQYEKHYGKAGDVLVWKAPTLVMHPGNPQVEAEVKRAYADDPVGADAEYGAEFRKDVEAFVTRELVDAVMVSGRRELPASQTLEYLAFVDVSGGTVDSFTLSISHFDKKSGKAVQDVFREWPAPFDPEVVVGECVSDVKRYRVRTVRGDRYGGEWPRAMFRQHGIGYLPCDDSKNDLYRDFLPLVNAQLVELLDVPQVKKQLVDLERRNTRGGRATIDHPPGGHDDAANATAGDLVTTHRFHRTAEERKAVPVSLTAMRAQQMEENLAKYQKPSEDAVVPERFKFLR
jgi:hypothetical protein